MVIYVDIDNTICDTDEFATYENAKPKQDAIGKINSYYDKGHTIIFWTARGTGNKLTPYLEELTKNQLNKWGVKYHELKFGKPIYDIFIDDKNINAEYWMDEDYPNQLKP